MSGVIKIKEKGKREKEPQFRITTANPTRRNRDLHDDQSGGLLMKSTPPRIPSSYKDQSPCVKGFKGLEKKKTPSHAITDPRYVESVSHIPCTFELFPFLLEDRSRLLPNLAT